MNQTVDQTQAVFAGIGILTIVLIVFAILLVPFIFYLLTLQKALSRCSPGCRAMNPGMVWLMLIPLFHIVWQFFVVLNMPSRSMRNSRSAASPRIAVQARPSG